MRITARPYRKYSRELMSAAAQEDEAHLAATLPRQQRRGNRGITNITLIVAAYARVYITGAFLKP